MSFHLRQCRWEKRRGNTPGSVFKARNWKHGEEDRLTRAAAFSPNPLVGAQSESTDTQGPGLSASSLPHPPCSPQIPKEPSAPRKAWEEAYVSTLAVV